MNYRKVITDKINNANDSTIPTYIDLGEYTEAFLVHYEDIDYRFFKIKYDIYDNGDVETIEMYYTLDKIIEI